MLTFNSQDKHCGQTVYSAETFCWPFTSPCPEQLHHKQISFSRNILKSDQQTLELMPLLIPLQCHLVFYWSYLIRIGVPQNHCRFKISAQTNSSGQLIGCSYSPPKVQTGWRHSSMHLLSCHHTSPPEKSDRRTDRHMTHNEVQQWTVRSILLLQWLWAVTPDPMEKFTHLWILSMHIDNLWHWLHCILGYRVNFWWTNRLCCCTSGLIWVQMFCIKVLLYFTVYIYRTFLFPKSGMFTCKTFPKHWNPNSTENSIKISSNVKTDKFHHVLKWYP